MGEKQTKLGLKTCRVTIFVAYIYLLIATFYKFITTNDIENFGMICISFIIAIIGNMPLDFLFEATGVSNMADVVLKCFIEFALLIVISFLSNYGYGEYKIRSYNNE